MVRLLAFSIRDQMPRRGQTVLRGRPVPHRGGNRLSPIRRRPRNLSVPPARRLLCDGIDPRRVAVAAGHSRGNRDPRRAFPPGFDHIVPVHARLGRRAAAVCEAVTVLSPEHGVGANPKATGSGSSPHRGARGVQPHHFAHASSIAVALVAPVRPKSSPRRSGGSQGHEVFMILPLQAALFPL